MSTSSGTTGRGAIWYGSDELSVLRGRLFEGGEVHYPSNFPEHIPDDDPLDDDQMHDAA